MALSERKLNGCICAVIAAAGLSSRMGDFKPLLPFAGKTVAACSIANLRQAGVDDVVVVTGYRGAEMHEALNGPGVRFAENPDYRETEMFDSLQLGLAALPGDCRRVVIQPIDMPAILPETITSLLSAPGAAVRPICGGKAGHPLVLDAALIPQILAYGGSGGLRDAMAALGVSVTELPTEDEGTLLDADTGEDYINLMRLYESRIGRKIYLFRHALPEFPGGVRRCLGLTPDLPLSAEGRADAAEWSAFLREKQITGIYTSPALRCRETAAALSQGTIPISVIEALHELDYGPWEGMAFDEIKARYPELYARRGSDLSLMPPGAETVQAAGERGFAALHDLLRQTKGDIAVVAHAGFNRALLCRISGAPLTAIGQYRQDYAHVNIIEYYCGTFAIQCVNQSLDELT